MGLGFGLAGQGRPALCVQPADPPGTALANFSLPSSGLAWSLAPRVLLSTGIGLPGGNG